MAVEIRQTIVTPDTGGSLVQLEIADASLGDAPPPFQIVLRATVRLPSEPMIAEAQRAALKAAQAEVTALLQKLANEIQAAGRDLT